ncbi:MAG TPA: twin-arginine translocase subunit TatC [Pyrinomonadaceae bacterium]|nr:twin-arginine translocase subunit TatC [Pyrinomonadaceae bacterium]
MKELETRLDENRGGQMSFLEHLDELRKRLVRSVIIIVIAFGVCFYFSENIYKFLSVPIIRALTESQRREVPLIGMTGDERVVPLADLKPGDRGRYVFDRGTKLGTSVVQPGTSVESLVGNDAEGKLVLFSDEPIITGNGLIPRGIRLPVDLTGSPTDLAVGDERLVVTTAQEAFTLYVTVSLYSAIAISIPLLLLQVWGFISPALYTHEKGYVLPFVLLSTISFVGGAAFAYYILFPPAVRYLLGVAEEFRPLLRATDYFDLITIVMLAMGLIFQMPAITYVLARIGLVSAKLLLKSWKIALIVILIVAAVVSPTGDIPNLMLFAAPMMVLYAVSIGIAWFFGKKRQTDAEASA